MLASLAAAVTTALKGKWVSLVVGLVVVPVWVVASIRLARPNSWWARRFYGETKVDRGRARATSRRYRALVVVGLVLPLAGAVALLALFKAYRIPSSSMEPTLRCPRPGPLCSAEQGDRVLVLRYVFGGPERGALVAYRSTPKQAVACGSGGTFIHRVVGLPGERVSRKDDMILINGEPLEEPYLPAEISKTADFSAMSVPLRQYFVLGDNRQHSCDSSVWGSVPRENIVGRVAVIYWPPGRMGMP